MYIEHSLVFCLGWINNSYSFKFWEINLWRDILEFGSQPSYLPRPRHQGNFLGPSDSTAKPTILAFRLESISEIGTYKNIHKSCKMFWSMNETEPEEMISSIRTNLVKNTSNLYACDGNIIRTVRGQGICKILDCWNIWITRKALSEISYYSWIAHKTSILLSRHPGETNRDILLFYNT
jgi:hypothetical protein